MNLTNLFYILTDALRSIRENLITTVLTSATLGFAIAIFALFLFIFLNINSAVRGWGDRAAVIVYLKETAPVPSIMREAVGKVPGVASVDYVSKDRALKELKEEFKDHPGVLEGVDANPLPASLEVKVMPSYRDRPGMALVTGGIKRFDWVEEVQYSQEWIEKFSGLLGLVELAALVIGGFLAAATLFIISNTIRLTVYARKDEIEIMRLVGASGAFVRIPFFIEGALQGFFGGAMALGVLWFGRYMIEARVPALFKFIVASPFPLPAVLLITVVPGILMGVAGSLISMGRFLRI